MDCSFKSLKSESVFLVDNGLEIYQWNGANSTLNHQIKCRMLTDRINKSDRGSNAIVTEFAEGEEVDDFKELLGFEGVNSEDNNNDDDSEKSGMFDMNYIWV